MKGRFLSRNRLIAALTRGTVVIEAARAQWIAQHAQLGRPARPHHDGAARAGDVAAVRWACTRDPGRQGRAGHERRGGRRRALGIGADTEERPSLPLTEFDRLPPAAQSTLDGLDWAAAASPDRDSGPAEQARGAGGARPARTTRSRLRAGAEWMLARRADMS